MALLLLPQNPFISLGNQNQAKKLYAIHDPVASKSKSKEAVVYKIMYVVI